MADIVPTSVPKDGYGGFSSSTPKSNWGEAFKSSFPKGGSPEGSGTTVNTTETGSERYPGQDKGRQ